MSQLASPHVPLFLKVATPLVIAATAPPMAIGLFLFACGFPFVLLGIAIIGWYLLIASQQYLATFAASIRATKCSLILMAVMSGLHVYWLCYLVGHLATTNTPFEDLERVERTLSYAWLVYLPTTTLLFLSLLAMNYWWLRKLERT